MAREFDRVEIRSRTELRRWLSKNHGQSENIWLVTYKNNARSKHVEYEAVVEEALCFSWVDSQPKSLDSERSMLRLSPRNLRSAWSKANKERVAQLIERGRMHPSGFKMVEGAKKNGTWTYRQPKSASSA